MQKQEQERQKWRQSYVILLLPLLSNKLLPRILTGNYSSLLQKLPSEEATIFAILNCKDLSKSIHKLEGFRI